MIRMVPRVRFSSIKVVATWVVVFFVFLFPSAVTADEKTDNGIAPCKQLQSLIEEKHLEEMPEGAGLLSSWMKMDGDKGVWALGTDTPTDFDSFLSWLRDHGEVEETLGKSIADLKDDFGDEAPSQLLFDGSDNFTIIYLYSGNYHCRLSRLYGRDQNGHWVMLPDVDGDGTCGWGTFISLGRIGADDVVFTQYADLIRSEWNVFKVDHKNASKFGGHLMCTLRAEFDAHYIPDVTEKGGTCGSQACKFLNDHGDEIGQHVGAEQPLDFVLNSEGIEKFPSEVVAQLNVPPKGVSADDDRISPPDKTDLRQREPRRWDVESVLSGQKEWLVWQPYKESWFVVSKTDHKVRKLEGPDRPRGYDDNSFLTVFKFPRYDVAPFVLGGKLYVLRSGLGFSRREGFQGIVVDVAEFDGLQFKSGASGTLDQRGISAPKFSYLLANGETVTP